MLSCSDPDIAEGERHSHRTSVSVSFCTSTTRSLTSRNIASFLARRSSSLPKVRRLYIGFRLGRGVYEKPPVDKEAERLERILQGCRKTVEDVRAVNVSLHEDALPSLERLCAELEAELSRILSRSERHCSSAR